MPLMRRGPGLIRGAARVGVAAGVAGRVRHHQDQKWAAQDQPADEEQAPAPQPQRRQRAEATTPPSSRSSPSFGTRA